MGHQKKNKGTSHAFDSIIAEMEKEAVDAVDSEVCKRFRQMVETEELIVSAADIKSLMQNPEKMDPSSFPEGVVPFLRHYRFMKKRKSEVRPVDPD